MSSTMRAVTRRMSMIVLNSIKGSPCHARPCAGHPRLPLFNKNETWMAGTSPAMTSQSHQRVGDGLAARHRIGAAAEVAGAQLRFGQHALDRLDDGAGGFRLAEMLKHHG